MPRDPVLLVDILESAKLVMSYASGKTKDEFLQDSQCQDAVIRRFEIIGEAAGKISTDTRSKHRHIKWDAMVGMRNILIHAYGDVDLEIVWETIQNNLPELVKEIENLLQADDP